MKSEKTVGQTEVGIKPELLGVPETLLWTLHNRASESLRSDGIINDPECEKIYKAIDYDYTRSFGKPDGSHATRSVIFDNKIADFLAQYPDGVIVNLGEGLETQRFRVNTENTLWISVDLHEAIALREHFIKPDEFHLHLSASALDSAWFDAVPQNRPVFITAQGLFMYFTEKQVQTLMNEIGQRFDTVWLMFDYMPVWMSNKTITKKGWMKTRHYRAPDMPWGIYRKHVKETFSKWLGRAVTIEHVPVIFPRGFVRLVSLLASLPVIRKFSGGIVLISYK